MEPLGQRPAESYVVADVHGTIAEATIARPGLALAPGDRAWITKTEQRVEVLDRAANGEPEAAEWLCREWFPRIKEEYATRADAE